MEPQRSSRKHKCNVGKPRIACLTLCRSIPTRYREVKAAGAHNEPVRIRLALAVGLTTVFVMSACSTSQTTVDQLGATSSQEAVDVPETVFITSADVPFPAPAEEAWPNDAAQRIVALATGSGEIITAMGGASRVVGRDETSSAPELELIPVVTKAHTVNAEQVIALNPDVVIIDAATSPPEAIQQIRETGISVIEIPEAWSSADIPKKVEAIGAAVGAPADSVLYVVDKSLGATFQDAVTPRVAFLYLRGTSAIYLLGGLGSGADTLINESGAVDVGAEAGLDAFTPITAEELVNLNPDTILVMKEGLASVGGADGLFALPGLAQTEAAQRRNVVAVDDTLLLSFGPRTGSLIQSLHEAWRQMN